MKTRQVIKIGIDISMTVLLFILMAFHYVGLQWHEVTGAVMLAVSYTHLDVYKRQEEMVCNIF